ncbi:hypothetical protein, partial [Micromonospora humida]|uniref:hypothetical protein n=1 Tax=Micromonospora humida TaxID=2809018 RepID=UPI0034278BAE
MTAVAGRAGSRTRPGPTGTGLDVLRRALAAPHPTAGSDRPPAHTPGPDRPVTAPGPVTASRAAPAPA